MKFWLYDILNFQFHNYRGVKCVFSNCYPHNSNTGPPNRFLILRKYETNMAKFPSKEVYTVTSIDR